MDLKQGFRCIFDAERLIISNIVDSVLEETCILELMCSKCSTAMLLPKITYKQIRELYAYKKEYFSDQLLVRIKEIKENLNV